MAALLRSCARETCKSTGLPIADLPLRILRSVQMKRPGASLSRVCWVRCFTSGSEPLFITTLAFQHVWQSLFRRGRAGRGLREGGVGAVLEDGDAVLGCVR